MPISNEFELTRRLFLLGAALMLAHQVAGKAVRDGLFLSQFPASVLPKVVVLASLVAVVLGLGFSLLLSRYGPLRLVPAAFAVGALLHAAEYSMLRTAGTAVRGLAVTFIYVHLVAF